MYTLLHGIYSLKMSTVDIRFLHVYCVYEWWVLSGGGSPCPPPPTKETLIRYTYNYVAAWYLNNTNFQQAASTSLKDRGEDSALILC